MDEDTSGVYKLEMESRVPTQMTRQVALPQGRLTNETAIIDLSTSGSETGNSGIHCLESITYLKKRKAAQLLAIELERLRVLNGRMVRVIDRFLAQNPEELGPRASLFRNAFVEELSTQGQETHGVFLKISRRENVEGSLYINLGVDIIRYRWDGTGGSQHLYLNGDNTFLRARSKEYATLERFLGQDMHLVFNECPETKPVSRRISSTLCDIEHLRYQKELSLYNSFTNRFKRLFGKGTDSPLPPEETEVAVRLSPLDLGITYLEHEQLVRSIGIVATGIERAIQAFQEAWSIALAADDKEIPED